MLIIWYGWSVVMLDPGIVFLPSAAAPTLTCTSAQPLSELEESAPGDVPKNQSFQLPKLKEAHKIQTL